MTVAPPVVFAYSIKEGADRVRGRGEMRGREGGEEGEGGGRRGVGGGRRGGGRREKRGREEGEGRGKGRGGEKREKFSRALRAPLQREEGDEGAGGGEVRGREGGEAYPPVHPLIKIAFENPTECLWRVSPTVSQPFPTRLHILTYMTEILSSVT